LKVCWRICHSCIAILAKCASEKNVIKTFGQSAFGSSYIKNIADYPDHYRADAMQLCRCLEFSVVQLTTKAADASVAIEAVQSNCCNRLRESSK